jgi:hypothetical protein
MQIPHLITPRRPKKKRGRGASPTKPRATKKVPADVLEESSRRFKGTPNQTLPSKKVWRGRQYAAYTDQRFPKWYRATRRATRNAKCEALQCNDHNTVFSLLYLPRMELYSCWCNIKSNFLLRRTASLFGDSFLKYPLPSLPSPYSILRLTLLP